jgi:hypothetical protein
MTEATNLQCDGAGAGTPTFGVRLDGVVINGATAGSFQVQFAQAAQDNSDTKMKANSCLLGVRLA